VTRRVTKIRAVLAAAAIVAGSSAAISCGFEDPNSISFLRGTLNFAYPKSLYVMSAVWRAQMDNIISRDDRPAAIKALLGYQHAVRSLSALRDRLAGATGEANAPAFSMMLIGPVLWTRYAQTDDGLNMTPHVDGPSIGDVVVVTDEPVIAALNDGRLTPHTAGELGLIRYYGSPEAVSAVEAWLDRSSQRAHASKSGSSVEPSIATTLQ
jgi:hypothetical protein